jgi:predicted SAM-dependent methyltransferase
MPTFRTLSPRWLAELAGRAPDGHRDDFSHEDVPTRVIMSRLYWLGLTAPVDVDQRHDFRLDQLLTYGLIDAAALRETLDALEAKGRLVDPEHAAAESRAPNPTAARQTLLARARLAAITQLAEVVAGDVSGMGADAMKVAPELADRLAAVEQQLRELADTLYAGRKPYAAEQLARLNLTDARDLKLHLGAGPTRLAGWVNIDVFPAEVAMNISWGLPFADGSAAFAYAGLVFEHLYYAGEALALLRDVRRVLAPGGVFRFIVPDMGLFMHKYAEDDRAFFEHWQKVAIPKHFAGFSTPMEIINAYNATGRAPSEFFTHKFGYDFETLEKVGRMAGFSKIKRCSYMASEHPELRVDEISRAARLEYNGESYSIFVELVK